MSTPWWNASTWRVSQVIMFPTLKKIWSPVTSHDLWHPSKTTGFSDIMHWHFEYQEFPCIITLTYIMLPIFQWRIIWDKLWSRPNSRGSLLPQGSQPFRGPKLPSNLLFGELAQGQRGGWNSWRWGMYRNLKVKVLQTCVARHFLCFLYTILTVLRRLDSWDRGAGLGPQAVGCQPLSYLMNFNHV